MYFANEDTQAQERERAAPRCRVGTGLRSPEPQTRPLATLHSFQPKPILLLFHFSQFHFFTLSSLSTNAP